MDLNNTIGLIFALVCTVIMGVCWIAIAFSTIIPSLTSSVFGARITKSKIKIFLEVTACFLGLLIATWPLYTEMTDVPGGVVVLENGVWRSHNFAFVWEWEKFANLPFATTQSSHVSVITLNPKNRRISYDIWVNIADADKYFQTAGRIKKNKESIRYDIKTALRYWCYEFNEVNSKELATFYNPEDLEQQRRFNKLVEDWIGPRIMVDGLAIKGNGFSIE